jgi:hypothetical protein
MQSRLSWLMLGAVGLVSVGGCDPVGEDSTGGTTEVSDGASESGSEGGAPVEPGGEPGLAIGEQPPADPASSWDYPGPCQGETTVPGTPQYLSADYHGLNPDSRVIVMPNWGRLRMGISCVGTGHVVIRIGPDSALCQARGKCEPWQLATITPADVDYVLAYYPQQVPLKHVCKKHGFGWYDATYVAPGAYLAVVQAGSGLFGLIDGHGTMDTYAYTGNGGAYAPVNCPRPVVCGDNYCSPGEYGSCEQDCPSNPMSCNNQCGGHTGYCACDSGCIYRGDCCGDACQTCGACGWGQY